MSRSYPLYNQYNPAIWNPLISFNQTFHESVASGTDGISFFLAMAISPGSINVRQAEGPLWMGIYHDIHDGVEKCGFFTCFFLQYKDLIIGDSMGDLGLGGNQVSTTWNGMTCSWLKMSMFLQQPFQVIWQLGFLGFWSHGFAKRGTYGTLW